MQKQTISDLVEECIKHPLATNQTSTTALLVKAFEDREREQRGQARRVLAEDTILEDHTITHVIEAVWPADTFRGPPLNVPNVHPLPRGMAANPHPADDPLLAAIDAIESAATQLHGAAVMLRRLAP